LVEQNEIVIICCWIKKNLPFFSSSAFTRESSDDIASASRLDQIAPEILTLL
jgi:hypothetical protein